MLCNIFRYLHHYGVIAASQICSVEKVLCRLTEQIFFSVQSVVYYKLAKFKQHEISKFFFFFFVIVLCFDLLKVANSL